MKILLDMNLPPRWVQFLRSHGFEAVHWSEIGHPEAADVSIMRWARENNHVVFTHDLDFSALLALSQTSGPSVLQARTQDVLPEAIGDHVVHVLNSHATDLDEGALLSIDEKAARVRILPIGRSS